MKKLKIILQSRLTYILLFIFIFIFVLVNTVIIKYVSNIDKNTKELIGIVTDLSISKDKISFTLKSKELVRCNYYLEENPNTDFNNLLGKKVKLIGKINKIYNNTIPNNFNYKKYLYNNKIYNTFTISSIKILEKENILYKIKNKIVNKMNNYSDNVKTYLNLLILGDKSYLDSDTYNEYLDNGIWHLFAISGMHITLIILLLDKILKKLKFKNLIISLILSYFMFLTNFAASVLRATIFYFLKVILDYNKCELDNKKILFLTAFIILFIDPFMIFNVGFQYSFIITYCIMKESNKLSGNYINTILKVSLLSFVVGLPISVSMNYEINLLSVFLNIIYVPFITFIVFPISILTYILPFFSNLLEILIYMLEVSNNFFNNLKMNIIIPKMSFIIILLYYLTLYLYSRSNNKKYFILLLCILIINKLLPKLDNNYNIYYLDVGQGDSSVIISPYKKDTIIIDTGGSFFSNYNITDNTISFLKSLGITHLNSLVLTHGDYDHMGEAINLVNNFKVEEVIFNCGEFNKLEQNLIKVLDKKKIPYYSCIKELNIEDNTLYFLNNKDHANENDNSSVIYTELNNHKFLFMGDAGVEVEEDLIEEYNLQNIDVLKVGHHGSKTSSNKNFIDEIEPKYSIISVGKNNRYGHPNQEVLENLNDSKIYRTDYDGSIMFKIKNNKLKIETCIP